jgi:hypothetical protein
VRSSPRQVLHAESAEALVSALPPLDVDWALVSDQESATCSPRRTFEASYDPTKLELTIRVTLVPELTSPDGGHFTLRGLEIPGYQIGHCSFR